MPFDLQLQMVQLNCSGSLTIRIPPAGVPDSCTCHEKDDYGVVLSNRVAHLVRRRICDLLFRWSRHLVRLRKGGAFEVRTH
jgi:hypothetical protein